MVEPSFVRGHGRRRARRPTVSPTLWTPVLFRPVHAWLVWCWPACVWSVYGQVAAAAAVLLVRGRLGRLMVGLVCVGSIPLLPLVVPPHVVYAAGMSVSVLVSGVVVCPSVVLCSLLLLVGRDCIGSVAVFCCISWVRSSVGVAHGVANPLGAVSVSTRASLAGSALAGLRVVCLRSSGGCSCGVVGARLSWPPHGRPGSCVFRCAAAGGLILESCPFSQHVCVCVGLWHPGLYKCRVV